MKPGLKGLVLNRVDCYAAIVFEICKRLETTKNVTGSPYPVSKSRILCALSVDALCGFGAKKFMSRTRLGVSRDAGVDVFALRETGCAKLVRLAAVLKEVSPENRHWRHAWEGTQ